MEFIILPLAYQGIEPKKKSIRELFETVREAVARTKKEDQKAAKEALNRPPLSVLKMDFS